jgi:hypothetical protein
VIGGGYMRTRAPDARELSGWFDHVVGLRTGQGLWVRGDITEEIAGLMTDDPTLYNSMRDSMTDAVERNRMTAIQVQSLIVDNSSLDAKFVKREWDRAMEALESLSTPVTMSSIKKDGYIGIGSLATLTALIAVVSFFTR